MDKYKKGLHNKSNSIRILLNRMRDVELDAIARCQANKTDSTYYDGGLYIIDTILDYLTNVEEWDG